jgi:TRAP-type uncharacterized transport system fused permease subunit
MNIRPPVALLAAAALLVAGADGWRLCPEQALRAAQALTLCA